MKELQNSVAYFRDDFIPFDQANLSIASAPVLYGLSIYTVFPVFYDDKTKQLNMFRLDRHFKRLQNSARILAFEDFLSSWDYQKFEATMSELLLKNKTKQNSLVRVTVFVDDILKGTRMKDLKHSISAFVYPAAPLLPRTGATLTVSSWRRTPDNSIPSRAKINGSYVNAALMKHEAVVNGFDDAIALDEQGHVTESTVSNMFIVRGGNLITPDGSADLLEGITRDSVFKLADKQGLSCQERIIDRSELYIADEIFLCGSSMSVVPVISIDHRPIGNGKPGKITKQFMKLYDDFASVKTSSFKQWLTPVK